MAKVMVSLPDDGLQAVDQEARRRGTTRSGYLRELAEGAIHQRARRRAELMSDIDRKHGPLVGHGGNSADQVEANRPDE